MAIAYLCGEDSIWTLNNLELLEKSLEESDKNLVRHVFPHSTLKGKNSVEYLLLTDEEFKNMQLKGEDVLMYFREDIISQIRRLKKATK